MATASGRLEEGERRVREVQVVVEEGRDAQAGITERACLCKSRACYLQREDNILA